MAPKRERLGDAVNGDPQGRVQTRNIEEEYPPRSGNTEVDITLGSGPTARNFVYSSPHKHFVTGLNNLMLLLPELISRISPETPEAFAGTQNIVRKAANYTATTSDYLILCDASAGGFTVSLPAAINGGLTLVIVKTDASANAIQIAPWGNDSLQGASSKTLADQWDKLVLTSDGVVTWVLEAEGNV